VPATSTRFSASESTEAQRSAVTVVICAYSDARWKNLQAAVASVAAQLDASSEIVLVIDHNEDLLVRARAEWPHHFVVANRHKQGLSGARNTGTELARGDLVAFLDDDAVAEPTWLARMVRHFADPAVGGVGGAVRPDWVGTRPAWFPDEFLWVVGCSYRGLPTVVGVVRNPIGASMVFRRSVLVDAGGFREEVGRVGALPTGCEETELSIRTAELGYAILYEPDSVVLHEVPDERAEIRYFARRCLYEGRSKAVVVQFVGSGKGLASESTYVVRTLPTGIIHNFLRAIRRGEVAALHRALVIVLGLVLTGSGYVQGRISRRSPGDGRGRSGWRRS
jgi:cellulose synthase/poly-beta-1,6-N-acetylglucosamine synthase-like glycosyltransferase